MDPHLVAWMIVAAPAREIPSVARNREHLMALRAGHAEVSRRQPLADVFARVRDAVRRTPAPVALDCASCPA